MQFVKPYSFATEETKLLNGHPSNVGVYSLYHSQCSSRIFGDFVTNAGMHVGGRVFARVRSKSPSCFGSMYGRFRARIYAHA